MPSAGALSSKARIRSEKALFGKHYDEAKGDARPKYGNLNVLAHILGDSRSRHYGQSYLVLKDVTMRKRTTITSGDSLDAGTTIQVGTLAAGNIAHVILDCFSARAFGKDKVMRTRRSAALAKILAHNAITPEAKDPRIDLDLLPRYQELQFHGSVDLKRDVDELVIHPDELGAHGVREWASRFGKKYGIRVRIFKPNGAAIPL